MATLAVKPYTGSSPTAVNVPTLDDLYKAVINLNATIDAKGMVVQGSDGANARPLKTDSSGRPILSPAGVAGQLTITRPANVTAYTAGDVVGGALEFTGYGASGAILLLNESRLLLRIAAIPSGMTSFRLHLYNVTPPSAIADNSPWTFSTAGDRDAYQGYIDLGTPVMHGASAPFVQIGGHGKHVYMAGTSLFAYLVTNGGFTPAANSEVYNLAIPGATL